MGTSGVRSLGFPLASLLGSKAALVTPVFSVVSGGVACVVGIALLAVAIPEMRRQRAADEDRPAETAVVVP